MSSHQDLADFIKSVHIDLRLRAREIGPVAAWEEHCANNEKLEKYASAMRELATTHWEKNNGTNSHLSRIFWVNKQIEHFFYKNGKMEFIAKEKKMAQKFSLNIESEIRDDFSETVSFLDVGSCYNPFSEFAHLNVTAVDLAPASQDVLKCDFLTVSIGDCLLVNELNECTQLPAENYHVILFSLLLEYMPSPKQRFECCSKAFQLLKNHGILIILTPDSKHQTANSKLLRNWRLALASIGFLLHFTEKLKHLGCLVFVKSSNIEIPRKWLELQKNKSNLEEAIAIPQDSNSYENLTKDVIITENNGTNDNNSLYDTFLSSVIDCELFN